MEGVSMVVVKPGWHALRSGKGPNVAQVSGKGLQGQRSVGQGQKKRSAQETNRARRFHDTNRLGSSAGKHLVGDSEPARRIPRASF